MVKPVEPEWGALAGDGPLSPAEIDAQARALLAQMTLAEKIKQMSGDRSFLFGGIKMARAYNAEPVPAGENRRLGIPGIRFTDGPRGVVMYHSTCFPVAMARGASWDVELEARIGDAIGVEARAQGANYFGGVCINLLRHPAWGRAQETYGEDPHHLGEMGAALVRGVQRHIMACIKHYACNSIERSRFKVNVVVDERALHEVYLPHFRRCVEAGAASVMSAYNKVNGEYCSHNQRLLTGILRDEWGFDGFVLSDFVFAVRDAKAAALAGLDVEMPFPRHYGRRLARLVRTGEVPEAVVDAAVLRILRQKLRFSRIGEPGRYTQDVVAGPAHRALAREAAEQSAVLLKNDPLAGQPLLPIGPEVRRIALLGRLAAIPNIGDEGSSAVHPPQVVTPLEGLRRRSPGPEIVYVDGGNLAQAAEAARGCDLAVVVAGYTHADEGEYIAAVPLIAKAKGGDRSSLTLSPADEALILAVADANPRTVVVLEGGSAIVTENWRGRVPAILMFWYPGMEGGHALANLLFGDANPSGKLPCVFPKSAAQLPFFDPHAEEITYDRYHGYRLLDRQGEEPAFAFGFGLSYTTFRVDGLTVETASVSAGGTLRVSAEVRNTGSRAGATVVQLYVGCEGSAYDRPVRELKDFRKITLQPGEGQRVTFDVPARALAVWDGGWQVEPGRYRVWAGLSSRPEDLLEGACRVV